MRIISTTDLSREGNDCYIYESISLVEQFDIYIVLNFIDITGWAEREECHVLCVTRDLKEAKNVYKHHNGVYREHRSSDAYINSW
jgi:hypothetical protein